jgi:glycine cleavage system H protein
MAEEFFETTADKFIFRVKKGLFYSGEGCWIALDEDKVTIGVTDFWQKVSGDVVFVDTLTLGCTLIKGEPMGQIETIKVSIELASPVSGVIEEVNDLLNEKPELINEDPFGQGWIYQVKGEKIEEEVKTLLRDEEYFALMKGEIERELDKIGGKE